MRSYVLLFVLFLPALTEDTLEAIYFNGSPGASLVLKEDQTTPETENIKSKEHTICYRYKSVSAGSHFIYDFWFSDDMQSRRKLGVSDRYHFSTMINGPDVNPHMVFTDNPVLENLMPMMAQGGTYFIAPDVDKMNADEWHHFCGGSSVPDMRTFFVQNGKTAYNFTQPELWGAEENMFWSNVLKKPFTTYLPGKNETWENMDTMASAELGYFGQGTDFYVTDFNVWGRALSREEMYDFTTCKQMLKGNWYSWDSLDWILKDSTKDPNDYFQITEETKDSVCYKFESKYEYFPDHNEFFTNHKLCRLFGGKVANTSTLQLVDDTIQFLTGLCEQEGFQCNPMCCGFGNSFYTAYNDIAQFNDWVDSETDERPLDSLNWGYGQPSGGDFENCAHIYPQTNDDGSYFGQWNDAPCDMGLPSMCEGLGSIVLTLRGLCDGTTYDSTYFMQDKTFNVKRFFKGNYGWKLGWDGSEWKITHEKKNQTELVHSQGSMYPLGKKFWQITGEENSCKELQGKPILLNLTPCNESSFSCDNGICIPMEKRCDQLLDCEDVSDEKNCQIISIDPEKYLKGKPPPPIGNNEKVEINIEIHILNILEINEVEALFRTQFEIFLNWKDPRITFWNLKEDESLNSLVPSEKSLIWTPVMVFDNTDKKTLTVTDDESLITVLREADFVRTPISVLDNVHHFQGTENSLELSRVYEESWICDYAMNWFPFDTQKCSMVFTATKQMMSFLDLVENGHTNLGPTELTQYFIRRTVMKKIMINKDKIVKKRKIAKSAIELEVVLGRRLLGNFLTIFLPTILLNIIGHATNYFKDFFFEERWYEFYYPFTFLII